ncbi:recombinase family protein [Pedobacter helvus]|uniref:Recombinase family protein n=1 Tax=Pedobacter helvus TaxID=2563444 RepID=A0ABW9JSH7_9SPHI
MSVYCGKIFIPKYKDEPSQLVEGQHEPLISEKLFHEVQQAMDGRKQSRVQKYQHLKNCH